MFVRKFQAETLEEALKDIKYELGPDAIILKTVTNRGLKGAFKRSKIEITAAIPENKLKEKMVVDRALGESKDDFYENKPSYISNMISNYASHSPQAHKKSQPTAGSYGNIGLNKNPRAKNLSRDESGLDSFLKSGENSTRTDESVIPEHEEIILQDEVPSPTIKASEATSTRLSSPIVSEVSKSDYEEQKRKIEILENKLYEMTKSVEKFSRTEPTGLFQLRTTLRSLDINEGFVQQLIRKAGFEFTEKDLSSDEMIFEFALREMLSSVKTEMPLFSSMDSDKQSVITVLISDAASGQSTMAIKLGSLKKNSVVIRNVEAGNEDKVTTSERLLDVDVARVKSIAEIISETRKAVENGKSVFIDYKNFKKEFNETKKFVEGLRRAFDNVEVLVSLSAIHSELYNRKVLSTYGILANGQVMSHLDLCMSFGAIFNLLSGDNALPAKFFGTGPVMPDDIEAASAERVLDSIFKFD